MYVPLQQQKKNRLIISLANPLRTNDIAEAKMKYDKLDASILVYLARADMISKCYVPVKGIRDVRSLIRYRLDLSQRRTKVKNKVQNILDKYMLKYKKILFRNRGLEWLTGSN